jgi:transposase-like protein
LGPAVGKDAGPRHPEGRSEMQDGKYRLPKELRDEAVGLYLEGLTLRQVGERLCVSAGTVLFWLDRAGVPRRPAARGSGRADGGELADVEPLRAAFRASGLSARAVARAAGMDERQVARVLGRSPGVSSRTLRSGERRRYVGVHRVVSYETGARIADALNVDYMEVGL